LFPELDLSGGCQLLQGWNHRFYYRVHTLPLCSEEITFLLSTPEHDKAEKHTPLKLVFHNLPRHLGLSSLFDEGVKSTPRLGGYFGINIYFKPGVSSAAARNNLIYLVLFYRQ